MNVAGKCIVHMMIIECVGLLNEDPFQQGSLALGTETQYDQDRWLEVLQEAARM